MTGTALTTAIQTQTNLVNLESPTTIETIKNSICKGASNEQLQTFLVLAKHFNLNPFAKEIYFSSQIGVFIGRHGKLRIANRHPDFMGLSSCVIREKDDFQYDAANKKILKHITGINNGKIIGAWATGKRRGFDDETVICYLDEYKKENPAWKSYTQDLISYKAEDRVLRKLFNSEFEGITSIDPEDEFRQELRPTFAESHSPAPASLTMSDYLGNDLPPSLDDAIEAEKAEAITDAQLKRFFARSNELKLSKAAIKRMLIDNNWITIDEEKKDYSTSTMLKSDYEAAYAALDELSKQVNQTDKQTSMNVSESMLAD
jgi:hypothetical protein